MARAKLFRREDLPAVPDLTIESGLWGRVGSHLAGIDEAGRGALAGPVAAAAVILPPSKQIAGLLAGVRDSKQMTPRQRSTWAAHIQEHALAWGVGMASCQEIDAQGIVPATRLAVQRALAMLCVLPDYLIFDGALSLPGTIPQTSLIKGDCRSLSIAAASVLAKTSRDRLMEAYDQDFPGYGFSLHKGYGTSAHLHALERLGPSSQHRYSFAPLRMGVTNHQIKEMI